jgi:hypothetical protein
MFETLIAKTMSAPSRCESIIDIWQLILTRNDEVLTYVARNLEPYRRFSVFMRSLPEILMRDGENGLLVDFFNSAEIAARVVEVLSAGKDGYATTRENARRTVIENYNLEAICLPAQLQLLERAARS